MTTDYFRVGIWQVGPSGRSALRVTALLDWLRVRVGPETLIVQNRCGREGHDANLRRKIDPQIFGLYGFAKADAQATLPAKVPANFKNIKLLREAYHSL